MEEDYQVKGDTFFGSHLLVLSEHMKFLDIVDDVVDLVIEIVLRMGDTLIFLNKYFFPQFIEPVRNPCTRIPLGAICMTELQSLISCFERK